MCIVQLPLVLIHPRKMRWLFFVKSVVAIIAAFALLGWAVHTAGGGGPVFEKHATVHGATRSWAWVAGINIAISGKTTLAINMVRNPSSSLIPLTLTSPTSLAMPIRRPTHTGKCFSSPSFTSSSPS